MKTFVIGDIHGRADLLNAALARIYTSADEGAIIFLGDYVDRGPESKAVLDTLMAGPQHRSGWSWIFIRGNHEDMLLDCHKSDSSEHQWWVGHGGETTLASFGGDIPDSYLMWLSELPRLHWDDHRVYTHAGVSESYSLSEQPESITQWYRYPHGADVGWNGKHVVHGHTPIGPEQYTNRTNLDGKAYKYGSLFVGVFDDDQAGGPIEIMNISI